MKPEDFEKLKAVATKEITFEKNIESAMEASAKVPNLYMRYLDVYTKEFNELNKLKAKLDKRYGELFEKYKMDSDVAWKNESEIKSQINRDNEYYNLRIEFSQQEYMVKHLEEILGNINRMGYSINAFIALKKLLMGVS
jgi:superfamily I DNA and/or RNA helicase